MGSELLTLLISHAVSFGNDWDDWHHLADAGHELEVAGLQLVWADEVDACIIHVLELQLLQQNALSLVALVYVLLPDKGQDLTDIGIAVLIRHVITVPECKHTGTIGESPCLPVRVAVYMQKAVLTTAHHFAS